jgi:hypothetical protein
MFFDLEVKSCGKYALYATYEGSNGERVRMRKGRAYAEFKAAIRQANKYLQNGAKDVEIVNTHSHKSYFFQ